MKARRMRSSSPKPARFATSTTPPTCLLSSNSRAVSTLSASTPLAGVMPVHQAVDAIASARMAALRDPEGEALSKCIADIAMQSSHRIAAE